MKTTIDIPNDDLMEVLKNTGAKTKREAILTAVQKFNKLKHLEALAERLHGSMPNFMTQEGLKKMREDGKAGK
ncbi:MAG: type II toxin-antitoxin system VapB family antitoxin [Verrucomicrobiota bacterium]|nr:type II toxin-antitoxin system VapB family antitoxin [Verrucomicrobiota bacterium]